MRRTRLPFISVTTLLATLLFASIPSSTAAQHCGAGEPGLDESTGSAVLTWVDVPDGEGETRGATVALNVRNTGDVAANIRVAVLVDFGEERSRRQRLRLRALPPGADQTLSVDLGRLRPPAHMPFSGQIIASADVRPEGACAGGGCRPLRNNPDGGDDVMTDETPAREVVRPRQSFVVSEPIYFHPSEQAGLFEIYGEPVLQSEYNGGAHAGLGEEHRDLLALAADVAGADVVLARIGGGGRGLNPTRRRLGDMVVTTADEDQAPGFGGGSAGGLGDLKSDPAPANGYRLCIQWEVQVTEQGRQVTLPGGTVITEDFWHGYAQVPGSGYIASGVPAVNDGRMVVTARGPGVIVFTPGWSHLAIADPVTGCFSFTPPSGVTGPFLVSVMGQHHDSHGNKTIVRNSNEQHLTWIRFVNPPKGKTRHVLVGSYGADATMAAMSGFGMYRSSMGVSGKTIILQGEGGCATPTGNLSSAHHRFDGLDDGIAYLRLSNATGTADNSAGPCVTEHRRAKFVVMHEMGHAWMLLRTEKNEPQVDLSLEDEFETVCGTGPGYTPHSMEFSAVGAREGMAHFYAASVWNNTTSANGVFTMFGAPLNIRQFSAQAGGQLWNRCDSPFKCGKSVNMDWARFWWNVHTPRQFSTRLSQPEIGAIYEKTILDDNLTPENYYIKTEAAMLAIVPQAPRRAHFIATAKQQGVRTSPAGLDCIDPPPAYSSCAANPPLAGAGLVGCPCADTLPISNETASLADVDGYHGDGAGSYMATGSAQYCFGPDVVCGVQRLWPTDLTVPMCQQCGVDTMIGCVCTHDDQCISGLDSEPLSCHGAPANGWAGLAPGTCLPDGNTPASRQRLVEMPWFCLDNCGSKGNNFTCLYDQLEPDVANEHARCVETVVCTTPVYGYCEAKGASMCDLDVSCLGDPDACCTSECTTTGDCIALGFPPFYSCDGGACVPPECVGDEFSAYCNRHR